MNCWIELKNFITPGGEPYYKCPKCGYGHLMGIEFFENYNKVCPKCGLELKYPFENKECKDE